MVKIGEKYLHFKGKEYTVLSVGRSSKDLRSVVTYCADYDSEEFGEGAVWVRDYDDFVGYVDVGGRMVRRFRKIEDKVRVKVKKLKENAVLPHYSREGDAGMDLCAVEDCVIKGGERKLIFTGISMELPKGYFSAIKGRSGLASKEGIFAFGGVIEYTYRGDYGVILYNIGKKDYKIKAGDRIAQVVIQPVATADVLEVSELDESIRGDGAFGSSGK